MFSFLLLTACISVQVNDSAFRAYLPSGTSPKNVIFLIGDGMGLSQVSAGFYFNNGSSNFERFSNIGLIKTSASDHLVTDSAAGATAFSTGVKTYNGAIGVNKDTVPQPTILEQLSAKGLATGVIATSSIQHATPASFYAHTKSRALYEEISTFLPTSNISFFAGGGLRFFNEREDGADLLKTLQKNGYEVSTEKLPATVSPKKQAIILAKNAMPKILEGRGDFLPDATKLALQKLQAGPEGFFLVVEGSQIDWGGHNNDADYLVKEQLDFDRTVGVALDFAKNHPGTLVLVTADHETGGFTLAANGSDYNTLKPSFSTGGHSATLIPVFAHGPGAEKFNGVYENTAIYEKLASLLLE
ncbi:MAG: alkaline phosphatase [Marinirhabdus sp.]